MVEEKTRIEDFDYHLPPALVAQYPLAPRDASRLLVLDRATGAIGHAQFRELANWLDSNDLLVVNDTRVFPARLQGVKESGGRVELLLHHLPQPEGNGAVMVRATHRGRLRPGQVLHFGPDLQAEIIALPEPGVAEVRFCASGEALPKVLERGEVPLPPYIHRPAGEPDRDSYQTRFARQTGAVACPTAGLHFTDEVLQDLGRRGIETVTITLHVGPGTFMPVRQPDYTRHRMLPEYFELSAAAAARLNQAKNPGAAHRGGGQHQHPGPGILRFSPRFPGSPGLVRPLHLSGLSDSRRWTGCSPTSTCPNPPCCCW